MTTELTPSAPESSGPKGASTGTQATRVLGLVAIALLTWVALAGLFFTPEDRDQRDAVRLLYLHPPTAWVAYLGFGITAVCSGLYLFTKKHSLGFDRFAGASAEIGTLFMGLTLIAGSFWGKITWGTWWQWDARLTTSALLFVTYIGYLAVRGLDATHHQRAKRSAIIGLIAVAEIPLVHFSVVLWRSLHQEASVLDNEVTIEGLMLFTLFSSFIAFTLTYAWMLLHRTRLMALEDHLDDVGLDDAISARHTEGGAR